MKELFWMIARTLGRGRLTAVNDAGPVQMVQVQLSQNELRDGTPRLAEYGFHSNPPAGADAAVLFLGGDRTQGLVIACGHQKYRMTGLKSGEIALTDDLGQSVYLTRGGIVVSGAGLPVKVTDTPTITLDSPQVNCTGNVHVTGNIVSDANITAAGNVADAGGAKTMAGMRSVANAHTHPVPGVQGGGSTVNSSPPSQAE